MRAFPSRIWFVGSLLAAVGCLAQGAGWTVAEAGGDELPGRRLVVRQGERTVAEFVHGDGQAKPYLAVYDGDGNRLTNPGLGPDGKTAGRFPHHRGIFIGWNRIQSGLGMDDLWHMRGTRMTVDRFDDPKAGPEGVEFTVHIQWFSQNREDEQAGLLVAERRTIRLAEADGALAIDHDSVLTAVRDLTLGGDLQHAGLHFRADRAVDDVRGETRYLWVPAELPPGNGRIVSPDLRWVHFRFPLHGHWYGVTQLNRPENAMTELSWRDYGRFGFFRTAQLAAGEELRVSGRFLVERLPDAGDAAALRAKAEAEHRRYTETDGQ